MYFRVMLIDQSLMMRRNLTILRKTRRLNNSETLVREKQTRDGSVCAVLSQKGFHFSYSTELKMYSLMMTANGHIDPHGTVAPPIIMRTAATPMPTPKSSLGPESILGDDLLYRDGVTGELGLGVSEAGMSHVASRRGSFTSMEPVAYDQRSLVSHMI